MIKSLILFCFLSSFAFSQILSLSSRERRAMRSDFSILDNAYQNGLTEHFLEFAEKFLITYRLASVDKNAEYRALYEAVKNAKAHYLSNLADLRTQAVSEDTQVIEDREMQRLFSAVLLADVEDIIAFAQRFPDYRTRDVLGAFERARVRDLESILAAIARGGVPVNEIHRFSQIYADSISLERIQTSAQAQVLRNIALLTDYRRVFGVSDFDERVEQILYTRIMYDASHRNLVAYVAHFPEGRYIGFIKELMEHYRR